MAYEYDAYGRLSALKTWRDTNNVPDITQWRYDEATGLLTNKVYADGVGPSYEYDSAGRLTKRTWARGVETDYAYDFSGQLTNIAYSDSTPDVVFTYDRLGRQLTATDALGTRTNHYDALSLLEERLPDGTVLARSVDSFGRPSGIALDADYAIGYGYDEFGRFAAVAVSNGVQFNYSYVPDSDLLAGWSVADGAATAYAYEPNRNLRTDVVNTFDGSPISAFAYAYDAAGRRTQRVDSGLTTNLFGYNMRSELADAIMGTNIYAYLYDPIGNRQLASVNEVTNLYQANELNQYTNINEGAVEPVYDPDGNLSQLGPWAYDWDGENRLISVASNGVPVVQNQYDYMSRRIMKATATQTNTFLYDGWNLIQERKANTSYSYVWGLDLSETLQGAGGVGGLLAMLSPDSCLLTPAYDANGNIIDLVDTNGAVVAHYEYDPYGNTVAQSGDQADANPFRFSSKYWDGETGFYYYGHRFYSPELGRWLSRDPIGERGWINLYEFVENTPLNRFDILGQLTSCECFLVRAVNEKTLPMWLDLLVKGCLSGVSCGNCGGDDGVFNPVTKEICIKEGQSNRDLFTTLKHELQHAYDLCGKECLKSCDECVDAEMKAQFCSGEPKFDELSAWGSCGGNKVNCNGEKLCDPNIMNGLLAQATSEFRNLSKSICVQNQSYPEIGSQK